MGKREGWDKPKQGLRVPKQERERDGDKPKKGLTYMRICVQVCGCMCMCAWVAICCIRMCICVQVHGCGVWVHVCTSCRFEHAISEHKFTTFIYIQACAGRCVCVHARTQGQHQPKGEMVWEQPKTKRRGWEQPKPKVERVNWPKPKEEAGPNQKRIGTPKRKWSPS